jgi:hypothetical protein
MMQQTCPPSTARIELRERQVRAGAVASGRVVVLAGLGLHLGDELLHGLHVDDLGVDRQHVRDVVDRCDRGEVGLDVEGHLPVERGIDRVRARGAEQQRVAVRPGARDEVRCDVAGGAWLVVDQHGGAEQARERLLDQPAHDVDARPGGEGHHDRDRPTAREVGGLRTGEARRGERDGCERDERAAQAVRGERGRRQGGRFHGGRADGVDAAQDNRCARRAC